MPRLPLRRTCVMLFPEPTPDGRAIAFQLFDGNKRAVGLFAASSSWLSSGINEYQGCKLVRATRLRNQRIAPQPDHAAPDFGQFRAASGGSLSLTSCKELPLFIQPRDCSCTRWSETPHQFPQGTRQGWEGPFALRRRADRVDGRKSFLGGARDQQVAIHIIRTDTIYRRPASFMLMPRRFRISPPSKRHSAAGPF